MSRSNQSDCRMKGDAVAAIVPAGTTAWITVQLIELTLRVWQPYYKAQLTPDEAVPMILGVGRLYEVLGRERSS